MLDSVAQHLGVTSDQLVAAYKAAALDRVAAALAAGNITQEKADALTQRINEADVSDICAQRADLAARVRDFVESHTGAVLKPVAEALGMTPQQLAVELKSGKSIADVAAENGVSLDTVKAAALSAAQNALQQAVDNGRITQDKADKLYDGNNIDKLLNAKLPDKGVQARQAVANTAIGAAASALNMTPAGLLKEMKSGKSIAQIAQEKGVSVETVKTAMLADTSAKLDQAVANGRLTQAQADKLYAAAEKLVDKLINSVPGQKLQNAKPNRPILQNLRKSRAGI